MRGALAFCLVLVLASCASEEPVPAREDLACRSELSRSHPANLAFWAAFEADDHAARAEAITALEAAVAEHPGESELELLLGLGKLWALADPAEGTSGSEMGRLAGGVLQHLRSVRESCPGDARIAAWLGPFLVQMGRRTGNQEVLDEGMAVLEDGAARDPEFVLFSLAMVLAEEPVDSPDFARAIATLRENIDVCGESEGDRACTNGTRAVHNVEGSAIFMGDLFARAGDAEAARSFYESARGRPDFASWNFQSLLDERLATLDERIQLSQDDDPTNDPALVTSTRQACSICHAD